MYPDGKIRLFQNRKLKKIRRKYLKFKKEPKRKKIKGCFAEKLSEALSQALGFNAATTSAIVKVAHQF